MFRDLCLYLFAGRINQERAIILRFNRQRLSCWQACLAKNVTASVVDSPLVALLGSEY